MVDPVSFLMGAVSLCPATNDMPVMPISNGFVSNLESELSVTSGIDQNGPWRAKWVSLPAESNAKSNKPGCSKPPSHNSKTHEMPISRVSIAAKEFGWRQKKSTSSPIKLCRIPVTDNTKMTHGHPSWRANPDAMTKLKHPQTGVASKKWREARALLDHGQPPAATVSDTRLDSPTQCTSYIRFQSIDRSTTQFANRPQNRVFLLTTHRPENPAEKALTHTPKNKPELHSPFWITGPSDRGRLIGRHGRMAKPWLFATGCNTKGCCCC